jgi:hypothetical protein
MRNVEMASHPKGGIVTGSIPVLTPNKILWLNTPLFRFTSM